jgi:serine/threonine-protein kinase
VARVADRRRQRSGATAIVVMLTILGMLAVGALGVGLYLANKTGTVLVPDLRGEKPTKVVQLLQDKKLQGQATNDTTKGCTPGVVTSQSPAPGSSVPEGSTVSYNVCTGPTKVAVPYLIGRPKADAENALTQNKLTFKETFVDSDRAADTVVSQSVPADTQVNEGTVVNIGISKGNRKAVPQLNGLTKDQALAAVAAAGITGKVKVSERTTNVASEVDKVVGQDPAAGGFVAPDAQITIFIGKKPVVPSSPPSASASPSA